jgi:hypothetical protein
VVGRLTFCVYDEARLEEERRFRKTRARRSWDVAARLNAPRVVSDFYLLDSWHNDLVGKFRTRLTKAVAEFGPAGPA